MPTSSPNVIIQDPFETTTQIHVNEELKRTEFEMVHFTKKIQTAYRKVFFIFSLNVENDPSKEK